jgi:fructose transport system permease protein
MAVVGALAVGQTPIISTAGIDLSIGMAMVLASLMGSSTTTMASRARSHC